MRNTITKALIFSALALMLPCYAKADIPPLAPGTPAPNFTAISMDGKNVELSDYRGKIVVLDFWASWCPWCIKDSPAMQALNLQYKGKGVVVLGLCVRDTPDAAFNWIKSNPQYTYSFAFDPAATGKSAIYSGYHVSGIPQTYVIDPAGNIVFGLEGYLDTNQAELASAIDSEMATINNPPDLNDGETLFTGTITKASNGTTSFEIGATSMESSNTEITTFTTVRPKTITTGASTTVTNAGVPTYIDKLAVGTPVYVVGKDGGKGKPLVARLIAAPLLQN